MSGSHIFVLLIIVMSLGYGLLKAWMGNRREEPAHASEAADMLARVDVLEERIRVLERIVTEKNHDLKDQIDSL